MGTLSAETLTPTEAAVVASVSVRDVNRVIDEKILPETLYDVGQDRSRRLFVDSCVFISFYFKAADRLTAEERVRTITDASRRLLRDRVKNDFRASALMKNCVVTADFLTIDLAPFVRSVLGQLSKLEEARALAVEDPGILGGTPVIRNTRIPVYDIAASVAAGTATDCVLAAYPGLTAKDVELAALYAEANPQRGRPRRPPTASSSLALVSSRHVPRRKRGA